MTPSPGNEPSDSPTDCAYDHECRSLSDLARCPLHRPLATAVAAVIVGAIGYRGIHAAATGHPFVGLLVLAVGAGTYLLCRRMWAIQHRHIVKELATETELTRRQD